MKNSIKTSISSQVRRAYYIFLFARRTSKKLSCENCHFRMYA